MSASPQNPLPPEIVAMGRPLQIHEGRGSMIGLALLGMGASLLLAAGLMVYIYYNVPFEKDDPTPKELMLYLAAGVGAIGLTCSASAWWKGRQAVLIGAAQDNYL